MNSGSWTRAGALAMLGWNLGGMLASLAGRSSPAWVPESAHPVGSGLMVASVLLAVFVPVALVAGLRAALREREDAARVDW